jgi:hypothetical protein
VIDGNYVPCFASGYVTDDEKEYLTNSGVQPRALKAMLERLVQSKDSDEYDYEAGNISEYGFVSNVVENGWIFIRNWPDYFFRTTYLMSLVIFGGWLT